MNEMIKILILIILANLGMVTFVNAAHHDTLIEGLNLEALGLP